MCFPATVVVTHVLGRLGGAEGLFALDIKDRTLVTTNV